MKYVALVAAAAMGVGLAHNAMAADFGFRGPVYQTPAFVAPTWTGVYIGVNGGWGWTTSNSNVSFFSPTGAFPAFTVPAQVITSTARSMAVNLDTSTRLAIGCGGSKEMSMALKFERLKAASQALPPVF